MQRVVQVTIRRAVIFAGAAFQHKAAAFSHALAARVFLAAVQAHPVRAQVIENPAQHRLHRLGDVAPPGMVDIGDVAHLELRRVPVHHAHIHLPRERAGRFFEDAPEKAASRHPPGGKLAHQNLSLLHRVEVVDRVAGLEARKVLAVAQPGLVNLFAVAGLVAAYDQPFGFD